MSKPPEFPQTPEGMKAWVESLDPETVMSLAESIASGDFGAQLIAGMAEGGAPDGDSNRIELPDPPDQPALLTVRLSLEDTEPEVWRRVQLPGDLHLGQVHDVIQTAMGWTDSHLHRFHLGKPWRGPYFVTQFDIDDGESGTNETEARLDQLLRKRGDTLGYTYDFGDDWEHTLRLESVAPATRADDPHDAADAASAVVCLDGAGACPPEDVGSIPGYEEVAEWVRHDFDPAYLAEWRDPDEAADLRDWLPPGWHPDTFSAEEVTRDLAQLSVGDGGVSGAIEQLPDELQGFLETVPRPGRSQIDAWLAHPGWSEPPRDPTVEADVAAALTTPIRVVLDVVGDGIPLTSAGYLPPKAVERIFTTLDLDRDWIGKGNREDLTPPVAQLRETVRALGLIRKAKGRLLPTARGRTLRDDPAALLGHVASRLPVEKDSFGHLASLVVLLAAAAGMPLGERGWRNAELNAINDAVCRVLTDGGWRRGSSLLSGRDVDAATTQTCDLLRLMLRGAPSPGEAAFLARLILLSAQ